ncbi:MAG: DUF898 domain-containing protein [Proteobacteria bacterium]|jgi:uncharacterized membrane protein YjgN (DUF898 family)|nr:DUF898 domain-containing protein [Pseudomonadota bacterium]
MQAFSAISRRKDIAAYPVEFTGSGGEYFRVWIVNVLLSILTLGLYTPWARRRTAQYFYGHTQVLDSPLEFAAEQRRMVKGFLLFVVLYGIYELALRTGQEMAASLLVFGFAALAPYLWASAMRFRLGATRWRGLRLAFTASWREVYLASWPVFAIAALWAAVFLLAGRLLPALPAAAGKVELPRLGGPAIALLGLALLLTLLAVIRLEYNYRRLFVARARIGGQAGRWKPVYLDFVKVWLATVLFFLFCLAVVLVLGSALAGGAWWAGRSGLRGTGALGLLLITLLLVVGGLLLLLLVSLPARAYREARMFQLVWNNIGFGQIARSKTRLGTGAFVWLRVRNMLLTFLTLGLFRPFAVASEYAAKVGSVTLYVKGGPEQLVGELVRQQGAFGDAAADALGLDLIG